MCISDWSSDVCSSDLYQYEEAARQGATGMLVIHETEPASYGWATVKNSNTNTMFDVVREDPSGTHPQLEGWIQRDFAVELFNNAGLDFEALKKQAQTRDFKPVERSEEHTSELQSLMRISYAVFCLNKKSKSHSR